MKKYLADLLSLLRVAALAPVILFSVAGNWKVASICLTIAWVTDLFDGPAARRWGSLEDEHPGFNFDKIADTLLAVGCMLVMVIFLLYSAIVDHKNVAGAWVILAFIGLGAICESIVFALRRRPHSATRVVALVFKEVLYGMFCVAWTFIWFAYMAWGDWAFLAILTVITLAALNVERGAHWLGERLALVND